MSPSNDICSIRILPVALVLVVALTAIPVEIHAGASPPVSLKRQLLDFILNVALYAPLGFALGRFGIVKSVAIGAALSIAIESLQLVYPGRFPSSLDVLANTSGAFFGALMARVAASGGGWPSAAPVGRRIAGTALATGIGVVMLSSLPGRAADFSNWDRGFELAVGDEITRDRPWQGEIQQLVILASATGGAELERLAAGTHPRQLLAEDLLKRAVFVLDGARPMESIRGRPLLDETAKDLFCNRIVRSGEITILLWVRPGNTTQRGPARIVTFSKDPWERNFTIGQVGNRLVFRLRTPVTGPNGIRPQVESAGVLEANRDVFVAAVYDGRVSRLYVDGLPVASINIAAHGTLVPFLAGTGLPAGAIVIALLFAIGALAIGAGGARRWILPPLGGLVGAGLQFMMGGTNAVPGFEAYLPPIALATGLVVAASVSPGGRRDGPHARSGGPATTSLY